MYAVIKNGGRQYKVSVGETLEVNRLPFDDGEQIRIEEVLLISDADRYLVGAPFVENAAVLVTVERQARGEKLIVFKYKSKKRYRHRRGHRQELTVLRIDDIIAEGKSLISGEAPQAKEQPQETVIETPETSETQTEETGTTPPVTKARRRRTAQTDSSTSSTEE